MKRYFAEENRKVHYGGEEGKLLSGGQLVIAGIVAGLANGIVSGPVEHIRIRVSSKLFRPCHEVT